MYMYMGMVMPTKPVPARAYGGSSGRLCGNGGHPNSMVEQFPMYRWPGMTGFYSTEMA